MFARRAAWDLSPNPLAERVDARHARGLPVLDLADPNPTHGGLAPAGPLRDVLAELADDPASARYQPDARGDPRAREAIARYHGGAVVPEHVVLTAGTSEGYAHLFRLLADPGDRVHLPAPGYGLFEHLAALEGVDAERYPLRPPAGDASWRIDLPALSASLDVRSRAIAVIHPHNPTGSFVHPDDWSALCAIARERGLAIASDEVFADFAFDGARRPGALDIAPDGALHFALSGASKVLALPQLKVAWIAVAGPPKLRDEALARLEFAADAYLSVSPIAARVLAALLPRREEIQQPLRARLGQNRRLLADRLRGVGRVRLLPAQAGWSAVLRVADAGDEEALALDLLDRAGVLVQPGFVFDFVDEGEPCAHLILSLLLEPGAFSRGVDALLECLTEGPAPGA